MEQLEDLIRDEILRDGPMTFARFMALALYHPRLGYYSGGGAGREPLGWSGDYVTSGDVHPLWGWAIARQLHQMWELLGQPAHFDVIEPGAGRGALARDVWAYAGASAPEWAKALRYTLVDRSQVGNPLREARERRLAVELATLDVPEGAVRWLADPRDLAPGSLVGAVVSNELVDALPVHVVEKRGETLAEVYVAVEEQSGRLIEQLGAPSSPAVATYLDRFHVPWHSYPDGWRTELRLASGAWLRDMATPLARGFVLTIDYGDTARRLYTRDRRRGTLMGYAHHRLVERPLAQPGQQDLTAHVNVSALMEEGRVLGLRLVGLTTQGDFLRGLGIREEAERIASLRFPAAERERSTDRGQADYLRKRALLGAVATLLNPRGLGGFRVLVQQRGVPGVGRRLLGLSVQPKA